nr:hypothetical protein GCM10020063_001770 [Dactylosporangium thailandense]
MRLLQPGQRLAQDLNRQPKGKASGVVAPWARVAICLLALGIALMLVVLGQPLAGLAEVLAALAVLLRLLR